MRYGWQGPCETTVTACAAGTHSIGNAARLIAYGRCDAVHHRRLRGGHDPGRHRRVHQHDGPVDQRRLPPFDVRRDGFVMAEGAGVLVLEEWDTRRGRGAPRSSAEVLGAATTADAHHITAPSPGGAGAIACMELALADAGLAPADIAHINAHGTSTPLNDAAEAEAIAKVFGAPGPPVTSIKGVTGHALGAAGALEAVAVVLSMLTRRHPADGGLRRARPRAGHASTSSRRGPAVDAGPTLSNSFGFGGHNGCLVIAPA